MSERWRRKSGLESHQRECLHLQEQLQSLEKDSQALSLVSELKTKLNNWIKRKTPCMGIRSLQTKLVDRRMKSWPSPRLWRLHWWRRVRSQWGWAPRKRKCTSWKRHWETQGHVRLMKRSSSMSQKNWKQASGGMTRFRTRLRPLKGSCRWQKKTRSWWFLMLRIAKQRCMETLKAQIELMTERLKI